MAVIGVTFLRLGLIVANSILSFPVLGTCFEAIGFLYGSWFVIRNFLTVQGRKNLAINWRTKTSSEPENSVAAVVGTIQVVIPLKGVVDIEALRAKLTKTLSKAEAEAQSLSARLSNPKFVDKAPNDVVIAARATLAAAEKQVEILRDRLSSLV
jgi:valyl-tRNA synthetase